MEGLDCSIPNKFRHFNFVPTMPDHGVPAHNVLHRLTGEDFAAFHAQVCEAAVIARRALDATNAQESAEEWQKLFGEKFPLPAKSESGSREVKLGTAAGSGGGGPRPLKDQPFF